jgi:adenosylcobinamide-GDP ribazoletransferase
VRVLLSFFTAYPSGRATLGEAASYGYLPPVVGILAGLPGVVVLLGLGYLLPAGLHHTDGLLDVGDALMVRGRAISTGVT